MVVLAADALVEVDTVVVEVGGALIALAAVPPELAPVVLLAVLAVHPYLNPLGPTLLPHTTTPQVLEMDKGPLSLHGVL